MIDLSCSVRRRFKERTWAQRQSCEFKESVKPSPPASLPLTDFESGVNSVSSTGVCEACGCRLSTVGHL